MFFKRKRQPPLVVRVAYRELNESPPQRDPADIAYGYSYSWSLQGVQPFIGQRVFVPGGDGKPAAAVIVGFGVGPGARGIALSGVTRVATDAEVAVSEVAAEKDKQAWLNLARRAAGLPVSGRTRAKPPAAYPDITPTEGKASRKNADEYGRAWWRVLKEAEDAGRPDEEIARYKSIAYRWFAVRDREK